MKNFFFYCQVFTVILVTCNNRPAIDIDKNITANDSIIVGVGCEGCKAIYESPVGFENLDHVDTLPDYVETGPKLLVTGIVYKPGGKIPAANVVLYVYHTDQK